MVFTARDDSQNVVLPKPQGTSRVPSTGLHDVENLQFCRDQQASDGSQRYLLFVYF